MMRTIFSTLIAFGLFAFCLFGDAPSAASQAELKQRVGKFYQAHVEGKFRQADAYVAEESKDYFFAASKSRYQSAQLEKVTYGADGKTATVETFILVDVPDPQLRGLSSRTMVKSYWRQDAALGWLWYIPEKISYPTPFGGYTDLPTNITQSRPGDQQASQQVVGDQVANVAKAQVAVGQGAELPVVADLRNAIVADHTHVALFNGPNAKATVALTNKVTGAMILKLNPPASGVPGFRFALDRNTIKPGETVNLTIERDQKLDPAVKGLMVHVSVEPSGQLIPVAVYLQRPTDMSVFAE